ACQWQPHRRCPHRDGDDLVQEPAVTPESRWLCPYHAEGGRGFLPRSEGRGSHPEKRMTTTSGPSARSGPSYPPPEATDPRDDEEEIVSDDHAHGLCDQPQRRAKHAH